MPGTKWKLTFCCCCSVAKLYLTLCFLMYYSSQFLLPSLSLGVCSNSCPLSQWCYLTTSFSVTPSTPALNLSQHQGLFHWVNSSHQVTKVLELQLQQQFLRQIFRLDFHYIYWIDMCAVQGTLKSFLQHHNLKASVLWHSPFFVVQLSHQYIITGKNCTIRAVLRWLTWWAWVWVNSGSWWWTGRPRMLQFIRLQRVRHDWATELNWTEDGRGIVQGNHFLPHKFI